MLTGLARDGGLYVPETYPALTPADTGGAARELPTRRRPSRRNAAPSPVSCFTDDEFRAIIERAYAGFGHTARCPLVQLPARTTGSWNCITARRWPSRTWPCNLIGQMFDTVLARRGAR